MSSHHKLKRECTPEEWRLYLDKMRPIVSKWKSAHVDRVREHHKAWRESHPKQWRIITKRAEEKLKVADPHYKLKRACRDKLNAAVKFGRLLKPKTCSFCFTAGLIAAHHENYAEPLQVVWLCSLCHKKLHQERKKGRAVQ